jgi:hypothetical protein
MYTQLIRLVLASALILASVSAMAADLNSFSDDELLAMRNICAQQHGHGTQQRCADTERGHKCFALDQREYDHDWQDKCVELDVEAMRRLRIRSEKPNPPDPQPVDKAANDAWLRGMLH